MKLDRWDPLRDMLNFHERMNRRLDCAAEEGVCRRQACWNPLVDVLETPDAYLFRVELPGVGKDNISIEVDDMVVTLSGNRDLEAEPQIAAYHSIERTHGIFRRSFRLPSEVNPDEAVAKYVDGLLELKLPKAEALKKRTVAIVCVG
jgi:HSP20 family protein